MIKLQLDTLESGIPALTSKRAGVHMEACVWCLLECGHNNQVTLKVTEQQKKNYLYKISWSEDKIDIEAINRAYNEDDGPEEGAVAIALLLIRERTDYTAVRRSVTGTGIDYWLDYKNIQNNQIFGRGCARLEISGILKQSSTNKPQYRISKKLKQIQQSDSTGFPAYIVVVEFSQPKAEVIYRNV
ncbi:hypothetical protein QUF64_14340 [Anaerolineales bacterium HSG6]|nr:hypothetical protein [Anaerolineales bacterium HSG6]